MLEIFCNYNFYFKELIKKFEEFDIKVIIDFVPNHTSDQHEWFKKSCINENNFADYYVWLESDKTPPNNWVRIAYVQENRGRP